MTPTNKRTDWAICANLSVYFIGKIVLIVLLLFRFQELYNKEFPDSS